MAGKAVSTASAFDVDDIQGIVAAGYGHLPSACFVLLRLDAEGRGGGDSGAAARAWLARVAERVTTARERQDEHCTNVALTHHGLVALGLEPGVASGFAAELVEGMTAPHRSRWLGDVGDSAPANWRWGGPDNPEVDLLLLLYAADDASLEELYQRNRAELEAGGLVEVLRLGTRVVGAGEPFRFADGISQPAIDGLGPAGLPADTVRGGEFVLGHRNEYGRYPVSPTVAAEDDPDALLAPAPASGGKRRDLGRNGTYLVFRELRQDVEGLSAFLDESTRRPDGTSDPAAATRLAAKMVGRWPGGAPLVLSPDADDPGLGRANDFGYFHEDRDGRRCPIGAHIRRANPRDSLAPDPGSDASLAVAKRHRIIRRGREIGAAGASGPDGAGRGLHFICLNANIARQFEFIQSTWCDNPKFDGLYDDRDPLVSSRPELTFTVPGSPVRERYTGLPSFVRVVGGAYFFLPGVNALRYLAGRA